MVKITVKKPKALFTLYKYWFGESSLLGSARAALFNSCIILISYYAGNLTIQEGFDQRSNGIFKLSAYANCPGYYDIVRIARGKN